MSELVSFILGGMLATLFWLPWTLRELESWERQLKELAALLEIDPECGVCSKGLAEWWLE